MFQSRRTILMFKKSTPLSAQCIVMSPSRPDRLTVLSSILQVASPSIRESTRRIEKCNYSNFSSSSSHFPLNNFCSVLSSLSSYEQRRHCGFGRFAIAIQVKRTASTGRSKIDNILREMENNPQMKLDAKQVTSLMLNATRNGGWEKAMKLFDEVKKRGDPVLNLFLYNCALSA